MCLGVSEEQVYDGAVQVRAEPLMLPQSILSGVSHLSKTIFVCMTEHWGGFLHRDTLYDTIHDYLAQAHIL